MNRVRVAFVLSNLDTDGGQTVVCTLLKHLNREKYLPKLFVLSPKVDNKLVTQLYRCNIEVCFMNIKYDIKYIRTAKIINWFDYEIKKFHPNVINVHLDTLYSWIWALWRKQKIIFTVHSEAYRISNKLSLHLFKKLDNKGLIRVIGVSEFASESFKKVFGAKEVITIYNPVNIEHYAAERLEEHKDVRFVNVARFYPVKNHKLLIDAFDKLRESKENIMLYLVGDGQEYDNINKYVAQKNLTHFVKFYGYIEDVADILRQSDVFVISSLSEAFPVSVIEALAAGLPIVATRVGGLPELVQENGILVESGDADALCQAMKTLAQNKKQRQEMGAYSKEMSKKFSTDIIVQLYEKIYDEELEKVSKEYK